MKLYPQIALFILVLCAGFAPKNAYGQTSGQKIYINFKEPSVADAAAPWNNLASYTAGSTLSNLVNDQQQSTTFGLQLTDSWTLSNSLGMSSGIYPVEVMLTAFYLGDDNQRHLRVFGLDPAQKYSFTFFASRSGDGNRFTQYTINGTTVELNASNNTSNTVQLTSIAPTASGEITIVVNRKTDALYGYLNALVIQEETSTLPQAPSAPTALTATAVSATQINLNWTDNSSNETGFTIERKTSTGSYAQVGTVGAGITIYYDAGLTPGTAYTYRVSAYNSIGSTYSSEALATTPAVATTTTKIYINFKDASIANAAAPWNNMGNYSAGATLSNLVNDQQQPTTVGLQLTDSWTLTNALGMSSGIYPAEVVLTTFYIEDDNQHHLRVFGLDPAKKYNFTFFASRNGDGNRITQYTINGATVELNASYNTSNTVQLTGIAPTASGEVTIVVNRKTGALYGYLSALVIEGETGALPQAPLAPTALTAPTVSATQVNLSWTDNSSNETGFYIERKTGTGSYAQVGTVGAGITTYIDAGLTPGTAYTYRVSAYNSTGNTYSSELLVTTPEITNSTAKIYINFKDPSVANAPSPWNNMWNYSAGATLSNLVNGQQQPTTIGLQLTDSWALTNALGMSSGIYPAEVVQTTFYIDDDNQRHLRVFGLDPAQTYSFTFFASRNGDGNRITQYTINGTTVELNASYNTSNTVQLTGIAPTASGEVTIVVNRKSGALYGYLSALVIEAMPAAGPYQPIAAQSQYNGNISAVQWKVNSGGSTALQADDLKEYDYYYDAMNRITASQYLNKTDATYNGSFDEGNYSYDPNGNLLSLKRSGFKSGVPEAMDDLTYSYGTTNTSNQLRTVSDAADKNFGFIDKNTTGDDYAYDANGNLTKDLNKGIDNITYNILNLPSRITSGADYIEYTYDATGTKLQKKVYKVVAGTVSVTTINYSGETEFYNNTLKYIHTSEGLAEYDAKKSSFTYEYFLKDHLGNTRAVVSPDTLGNLIIGQATDYYPFGMAFIGVPKGSNIGSDNKYQYNGKELQDEALGGVALDWLDYGRRFYDPQIARFISLDPLAEHFPWMTCYQYASNEPIKNIDLDGLEGFWFMFSRMTLMSNDEAPLIESVAKAGGEIGGKTIETGTTRAPRFTPQQLENFARGNKVEAEQLAKNGLDKNTESITKIDPKTGKEGTTIPDALKNGGKSTSEVKNVGKQSLTKQLRLQEKFSNDNGFKPELIINEGAKLSKPLKGSSFDIIPYQILTPIVTPQDNVPVIQKPIPFTPQEVKPPLQRREAIQIA